MVCVLMQSLQNHLPFLDGFHRCSPQSDETFHQAVVTYSVDHVHVDCCVVIDCVASVFILIIKQCICDYFKQKNLKQKTLEDMTRSLRL